MPPISGLPSSSSPQLLQTTPAAQRLSEKEFRQTCENALDQIQAPDLPRFLRESTGLAAERLKIVVDTFKNSPEFVEFKHAMLKTLENLHGAKPGDDAVRFDDSRWGYFAKKLGLMSGLSTEEQFDVDLYNLYYISCTSLQRLGKMLELVEQHPENFSTDTKEQLTHQISMLSKDLAVCGPGVIQNIADAHDQAMQLVLPPDFSGQFTKDRIGIARQCILEFVKQHLGNQRYFENNEKHMVASIQNHFAKDLDLPIIDDRYASRDYVNDCEQHLPELQSKLEYVLSVEGVATNMARHLLIRIESEIAAARIQSSDHVKFHEQLSTTLSALKHIYGTLDVDLVYALDDNFVPLGITRNPTLLTLHLIKRLPEQVYAQFQPKKMPIRQTPNSQACLAYGDELIWIEEQNRSLVTKQRCIERGDLENPTLINLFESEETQALALAAVYEALRNTNRPAFDYFRRVDFFKQNIGVQTNAVLGAIESLPDKTAKESALETKIATWVKNGHWQSWLDSEVDVGSNESISFRSYVLEFSKYKDNDLPKPSAIMFDAVLGQAGQLSFKEMQLSRQFALAQSDTRYVESLIEKLSGQQSFTPDALFSMALEMENPNTPVLCFLAARVQKIKDTENFKQLLASACGSDLTDADSANILHALINHPAKPDNAECSSVLMETLRNVLTTDKVQTARVLLQHLKPQASNRQEIEQTRLLWQHILLFGRNSVESMKMLNLLIEQRIHMDDNEISLSPLMGAYLARWPEAVALLLEAGANALMKDVRGQNILHRAAAHGGSAECMKVLLEKGVPCAPDNEGKTPLDIALELNHLDLARVLQDSQTKDKVNTLDEKGYTPLHNAILKAASVRHNPVAYQAEKNRIQILLDLDADPNAKTSWAHRNKGPLHLAYKHRLPEIIEMLKNKGANETQQDFYLRTPAKILRRQ